MRKSANRSLRQALLASVVAHAVVLASLPDPTPSPRLLAVRHIDARLVARPGILPAPAHASAVAALAHGEDGAVRPPATQVHQSVADSGRSGESARSVRSTRRTPSSAAPARSLAKTAPQTPARPPDDVAGHDAVPAAAAATEFTALGAVSAEAMRQYRVNLALAARGFYAYPDVARTRGWQGTVEVVLEAGVRSPEPRASLWRSSGYAALDAQAVETLARAARATPLPAALKARELRVVVAVRFDLDAER